MTWRAVTCCDWFGLTSRGSYLVGYFYLLMPVIFFAQVTNAGPS